MGGGGGSGPVLLHYGPELDPWARDSSGSRAQPDLYSKSAPAATAVSMDVRTDACLTAKTGLSQPHQPPLPLTQQPLQWHSSFAGAAAASQSPRRHVSIAGDAGAGAAAPATAARHVGCVDGTAAAAPAVAAPAAAAEFVPPQLSGTGDTDAGMADP